MESDIWSAQRTLLDRNKQMNLAEIDIDRIVKAVLKNLQRSDAGPSIFAKKTDVVKQNNDSQTSVQIAGRVITADLLAENKKQAAVIQLEPKAIITPAARDYIKEHGLIIATGITANCDANKNETKRNAGDWLAITVQGSDLLNTAMASVSREAQITWGNETASSVEQAAKRAAEEIGLGRAGVLIVADKIAMAACLVNRNDKVRGIAVRCSHDFAEVTELNANVVCLPGKGLSFTDYRNILKSIVTR